jgi:hypothetical protein
MPLIKSGSKKAFRENVKAEGKKAAPKPKKK